MPHPPRATAASPSRHIAILGGGIMGCCAALALAERGIRVTLFERHAALMTEASLHNEGKLHMGFVYAADPSFRTAALMQRGAASFLPVLSRWLPQAALEASASTPFLYAVPRDSQLTPEAIAAHFARIGEAWQGTGPAARWADHRRLSQAELAAHYNPDAIAAAFETGEIAVNSATVARLLAGAVAAHPRIEVLAGATVTSVESGPGGYAVLAGARHAPFDAVANCLWSNRAAIDIASGLAAPEPFLNRFKVGLTMQAPPQEAARLASTTFVIGPYGDIIAWPDGRIYLSWYPVCMLGMWRDAAPRDHAALLAATDRAALVEGTIAGLSHLSPGVKRAAAAAGPVAVHGGAIFALGATDIHDRASRLHERHAVGLVAGRGGYHSVDTGKYVLAPVLALDLAGRIAG